MFTKKNKRISLLRYWTTRYLVTLCIGLIIIGYVSILWINKTTLENKLNLIKFLAEESADRVIDPSGQIIPDSLFYRFLEDRKQLLNLETEPLTYIVSNNGDVIYRKPGQAGFQLNKLPASILQANDAIQTLKLDKKNALYLVKAPIQYHGQTLGWVVIMQSKSQLANTNQEYTLLSILLISLALLGWLVIYFLSQKLSKPIKDVAAAAKQIQAGHYPDLMPEQVRETEVYELLHSFKEMSGRLQHLESLREELLAGITHELKTPVTSISSITQALKDEVVTGVEAKEFLTISLKETNRLQKMIEDLLDFNSFSAGAIRIQKEEVDMNELIEDITHQWAVIHDHDLTFTGSGKPIYARVDPVRVEQIVINLLNNAKDATEGNKELKVQLYEIDEHELGIDVSDHGQGIPDAEQNLIFERFFRGENKKHKVRGLGLGLPFSKMLAEALGGTLDLKHSSSEGTTFTLQLPRFQCSFS